MPCDTPAGEREAGHHACGERRDQQSDPGRSGPGGVGDCRRDRHDHAVAGGVERAERRAAAGTAGSPPAAAVTGSDAHRSRAQSCRFQGLRARTIAELACSWTRCVSWISMSVRPASARVCSNSVACERAGDAAGPLLHVRACRFVHVGVGDHVRDGEAPAGAQHPCGLSEHLALVGGEVDHAVRDHDVDGVVCERDVLDVALDELDVFDAGVARRWRVRGRASRRSCRARSPCRSEPTRRAEISTSAPAPEPRSSTVSPSCRSATAVGTPQPSEASTAALRAGVVGVVVERRAEDLVAVLVGRRDVRPAARDRPWCSAAPRTGALGHGGCGGGVAIADALADVGVGQLSHADSSSSESGIT